MENGRRGIIFCLSHSAHGAGRSYRMSDERNSATPLALTLEEYKLIINHRRLRDKVAHLNKVTKIAKRLDPDAWRDPDACRTNGSELKTRRDASLTAAEKEIAN